jgi:hypothetical protein
MKQRMKLYHTLLLISFIFSGIQLFAQEDDYTQYYLNLPAVNSAFTGMDDFFSVNAGLARKMYWHLIRAFAVVAK